MDEASEEDRAHFRAIAEGEALSEEERIERALEMTPGERMLIGLEMGAKAPWSPAHWAELDARTDGHMEIARRRVAMGLSLDDEVPEEEG